MKIEKCTVLDMQEKNGRHLYFFRSQDVGMDFIAVSESDVSLYRGGIYSVTVDKEESFYKLRSVTQDLGEVEKKLHAARIPVETVGLLITRFGCRVFDVIKNEPGLLEKVKGIGKKKSAQIVEAYTTFESSKENAVVLRLGSMYNLSDKAMGACAKRFEGVMYQVEKNPFLLCELSEVSFSKIDDVWLKNNGRTDDMRRLQAAVKICIQRYCVKSGDMAISPQALTEDTYHYLDRTVSEPMLRQAINRMVKEKMLIYEFGMIYDHKHYELECEVASKFYELTKASVAPLPIDDKLIAKLEKKWSIQLDEKQKKAIFEMAAHPVTVIVGGPGTGKSTVISILTEAFQAVSEEDVIMMAPTGRAARRMSEVTNFPANTIHSQLRLSLDEEEDTGTGLLDAGLVVVDEVSMVPMHLASKLLTAVKKGSRLVLIGDKDQLPSIQEGAFLRDCLALGKRGKIGFSELSRLFRQGEGSNIPVLADCINTGKPALDALSKDVKHISVPDDATMAECLFAAYFTYLQAGCNLDEVMVLAPLKQKGNMCTNQLNRYLQDKLNPKGQDSKELEHHGVIYRTRSRVIHTEKNTQEVSNGDLGTIIDVADGQVIVLFDSGNKVTYKGAALHQLELAFAVSVHKSQGSQFKAVILPLHLSYMCMATRELYYTAVTRARKHLTLIGDMRVIQHAASTPGNNRLSYFAYRVLKLMEGKGNVKPKVSKKADEPKNTADQMNLFEMMGKAG